MRRKRVSDGKRLTPSERGRAKKRLMSLRRAWRRWTAG